MASVSPDLGFETAEMTENCLALRFEVARIERSQRLLDRALNDPRPHDFRLAGGRRSRRARLVVDAQLARLGQPREELPNGAR